MPDFLMYRGGRPGPMIAAALILATTTACGPSSRAGAPATSDQAGAAASADWLQFGGDASHSNVTTAETAISPTTVSRLARTFTAILPGKADGPPVFLSGVRVGPSTRDVVFAETTDGHLSAVDARRGTLLWTTQDGPGSCRINQGSSPCYTNSQPAIDPGRRYIYSYGLDGFVHKRQVGDGVEVRTGGWPERATAKAYDEKSSPDLTIATTRAGRSYLYVANGGYPGDRGDYQGHVTVVDLATGGQKVFNTLCSNQASHFTATTPNCAQKQSAVWARGSVTYDPAADAVYFATGNGAFDPAHHHWADSVLKIAADGSGRGGNPLDTYTPTNQAALNQADLDLGSTAPVVIPAPAGSSVTDLGVQSGKDAKLRLLNLADLSGQGGPGHLGGELQIVNVPQGGGVLTQPVAWRNPADGKTWLFVANGQGLAALEVTLAAGRPSLVPRWKVPVPTAGTTPVVANGVLFYLTGSGARALNATTGATLWSDNATMGLHWQSPIVAGGSLYYSDGNGTLRAYALPQPAPRPGFTALTASRLYDSRFGAAVAGRTSVAVPVAGAGGVPATGASAVILTVTVTAPSRSGFITAYASGASVPGTSNGNFAAGQTLATSALVPLGGDGRVAIYNGSTGPIHVIVDVTGYFSPAPAGTPGRLVEVTPTRLLDSRLSSSVPAGASVRVPVAGRAGIPASGVAAVVATVTAAGPRAGGYLRAYAGGAASPATSTLNFRAAQTVANLAVVAVGADGAITVLNRSTGPTEVIVDVTGYFAAGTPVPTGSFAPLIPARLLDSRAGSPVAGAGSVRVPVTGRAGVPGSGVAAAVVNVTVTAARTPGYLTTYAGGTTRPATSNVNFAAGSTVANLAVVPIGTDGSIVIANRSAGSVHVIVDIVGYLR